MTIRYDALPYLVRRVLRIIARNPEGIDEDRLNFEADLDASARPQIAFLELERLAVRRDSLIFTTPAGEQCLADYTPPKLEKPYQAVRAIPTPPEHHHGNSQIVTCR